MADVDIDVDINTAEAVEGVRRLNLEVNRFDERIRRADDTTRKFERRVGGSFRQALQDVRVLLGAIGIGVFVREMVSVNAAFEQVKTTLVAASTNMNIVGADFAFIRSEAVRLGMPVKQVGGEFAKLAAATRGTVLEGSPAREIYSSLAEAFVATGQGADEFRLAVLAVNQMVSKGRVQAEELRGQLGERLPGAYQAAARAAKVAGITMNGTTAELSKALEMGQVTAEKLLPALGKELRAVFGDAFKVAQSSPRFVMGQFQVAVESLLYTLSNKGFMVEFLGLLKDLSGYLSSEEGVRGAERLGSALGFLMSAVRDGANVIVRNLDGIVTVLAGLGSGAAVLGIRSLISWIGNLTKAAGLLRLLSGPWGWLAMSIGFAVSAVAGYGDALMTLGGKSARLGDWFKATFEVGSEAIRNDMMPALNDMIVGIPYVGEALVAAGSAMQAFNASFAKSNNLTTALNSGWSAFLATLDGSGAIGAGLAEFFRSAQNFFASSGPMITSMGQAIRQVIDVAVIAGQELGEWALGIGKAVWNSLKGIGTAIGQLVAGLWDSISTGFGGTDWNTLFGGIGAAVVWIVDITVGLILTIIDTTELAVDLIVDLFQALLPVINPIVKAIGAVFARLVDYTRMIFEAAGQDTSGWNALAVVAGGLLAIIAGISAAVVGTLTLISNVLGPVIDAVFSIVGDVWSAIEGLVTIVYNAFTLFSAQGQITAAATAEAQVDGAKASTNGWIVFGDVVIGIFISTIEIIAQVIKQVSNLVTYIADATSKIKNLFGAARSGWEAMAKGDLSGMQAAGDKLLEVAATPIKADFGSDWQDFVGGFGDNFNAISSAVDAGKDTINAFAKFANDVPNNFGNLPGAMNNVFNRAFGADSDAVGAARAGGEAAASAYVEGFGERIAGRASGLTAAATESQRLLNDAQELAAQDAARAYAEREAGIDRTPETIADKKKGGDGKGGKTAGERARDRIAELAVEISMNNSLIDSLEKQQITREQLSATIKATETLRRAGYDMTYDDALAAGGMAKQLAAIAYEAEVSEMKLKDVRKAVEAFADISLENTGLQTQLRAAQNLSVNRREYGFQMEAMQELIRNNINMTYDEAIAAGGLAAALATVARQRAELRDNVSSSERVASAIEGYKGQAAGLQLYAEAAARGQTSTWELDAAMTAQNAVMSANGKTLWEGVDALNANERALYNQAYASAVAATGGKNLVEMSNTVNEKFYDLVDPIVNAKQATLDWGASMTTALTAQSNALDVKSPEIIAKYQDLMAKINEITRIEMLKNSNNLVDRFQGWMITSRADIEDWAGNISGIFSTAFDGMTDVLTDFIMTGKLEWKDLALSVIADITRMMIKWLAFQALKAVGSFFGIPMPFADGGVMTSGGSAPLKTYSKGGIANSPQLALFGEGRQPEAYVPLPDGRTIPVTLSGMDAGMAQQSIVNNFIEFDATTLLGAMSSFDSAFAPRTDRMVSADAQRSDQVYTDNSSGGVGSVTINTEVTYQSSGSGNSGPSDGDQKAMQNMSKELSSMIKQQVIEVMQNETRPGGHFNKLGRKSQF